jgi:hypothetical protein
MGHTEDAMESADVSTKQRQIARLARIHPEVSFTSLAYHIDLRWLLEAYQRTRKDGRLPRSTPRILGATSRVCWSGRSRERTLLHR